MSMLPGTASPLGKPTSGNLGDYLSRVFTPEQEARVREIVREELRLAPFSFGSGKVSSPSGISANGIGKGSLSVGKSEVPDATG